MCLCCLCIIPLSFAPSEATSSEYFPSAIIPKDLAFSFSIHPNLADSTVKDLHFRFFYSYTNTTINNVSFFINITKGNNISMKDLFFANPGVLAIHLQPKNTGGNWTVFGDHDPVLGGWMSNTGELSVTAPTFTEGGLYHIQTQIMTLDYPNAMTDQSNPPKFDSWWFMDENGNISKCDISKTNWVRNTYEWWLSEKITDQQFNSELQYLIDKNIIRNDNE